MSEAELRLAIAEVGADGVSISCMIGIALFNAISAQAGVDFEQFTSDVLRNLRAFGETTEVESVQRAMQLMANAIEAGSA